MPLPCYHSVISRSDLHISFSRRRSQVFNPSPYIIIIEIFPSIYAFYTHTFLREHKIAVKAPLNCTEITNYRMSIGVARLLDFQRFIGRKSETGKKDITRRLHVLSSYTWSDIRTDTRVKLILVKRAVLQASGDGRWRRRHQALVSEHSLARKIWQNVLPCPRAVNL